MKVDAIVKTTAVNIQLSQDEAQMLLAIIGNIASHTDNPMFIFIAELYEEINRHVEDEYKSPFIREELRLSDQICAWIDMPKHKLDYSHNSEKDKLYNQPK